MADALLTLTGDAELTAAFARALAPELRAGDTLLLDGPVGAGKSHFARALIRARLQNPAEDVPSPTFTLVQTYDGDPPVWHADLYRLTDAAEVDELGLTDALPEAIALIEWPDRMGEIPGALTLHFRPDPDPEMRRIELAGTGWARARRAAERARFAHAAGWGEAAVAFLAGDASARRYFRLTGDDGSAVLMDSDPKTLAPYLAMTAWLRERGFDAPRVIASDPALGLALIEDFGDAQIARVIAADLNEPAAEQVAARIREEGGEALAAGGDVADAGVVEGLVGLARQNGGLHLLVNNAGIGGESNPTGEYSLEGWHKVIDVNLHSVFYGLRYGIPAMLEAGGGAIVNMASILGSVGFADAPAYVAAKHAVVGLTRTAAMEYAGRGIRVNAVGPAFIDTPLLSHMPKETIDWLIGKHPVGRLGQAAEVSALVLFLLSNRASFITGSYHLADGGYTAP